MIAKHQSTSSPPVMRDCSTPSVMRDCSTLPVMRDCSTPPVMIAEHQSSSSLPVMRNCSTPPAMIAEHQSNSSRLWWVTTPVTVALRLWCMTIAAALLRWRITWAKRTLNQKNQILYPQNFIQKKGYYSGPTVVEQSTFLTPMGFVTINIHSFSIYQINNFLKIIYRPDRFKIIFNKLFLQDFVWK